MFSIKEEVRMQDGDITLSTKGKEVIVSRPFSVRDEHLTHYGAKPVDGRLMKCFPAERFFWSTEDVAQITATFRRSCDFISGMSGYSALSLTRCNELGIRPGSYEEAVYGIFMSGVTRFRDELGEGLVYGIVHGSSDTGVDLAVQRAATEQKVPQLGFTCLEYLWYVDNAADGCNICILRTKEEYGLAYVHACDVLMAANGGPVSYDMDIAAATRAHIPVIPVDVLGMLGTSVPPFKVVDGRKVVNDAAAAIIFAVRLIDMHTTLSNASDRYRAVSASFAEAVVARAREVVPVASAYPAGRSSSIR